MMSNTKYIYKKRQRRNRQRLCCIILAALAGTVILQLARPRAYNITHYITYEVCAGDTLWSVARATYGDTVDIRYMIDHISKVNGIEGGRIYPGQALSLPVCEE